MRRTLCVNLPTRFVLAETDAATIISIAHLTSLRSNKRSEPANSLRTRREFLMDELLAHSASAEAIRTRLGQGDARVPPVPRRRVRVSLFAALALALALALATSPWSKEAVLPRSLDSLDRHARASLRAPAFVPRVDRKALALQAPEPRCSVRTERAMAWLSMWSALPFNLHEPPRSPRYVQWQKRWPL